MRKITPTILFLGAAFAFTSCHHDNDKNEPKHLPLRTVLVYIAAENNLATYANDDLEEMKTGSLQLTDEQNLIVYVDKAQKPSSNMSPFLARVKDGELVDTVFMQQAVAADPSTLQSVISYTKAHYEAQSYGLVLWGHASGWLVSNDTINTAQSRAYGGSTGTNSSSGSGKYWMNIAPMARAIANSMGSDKFRFILGDCCSFACLEVAYELRNVAEYIIGSPAEIPDMGAPFNQTVPDMFRETDNFYEQIINNYFDYYLKVYKEQSGRYYNRIDGDLEGYSEPLAAIRTSELNNLAEATAQLLSTIPDKICSTGELDLSHAVYYAILGSYPYSYDICHVLRKNTPETAYLTWKTVYDTAVPYHVFSRNWMTNSYRLANDMLYFETDDESDCGCVSMFFPSTSYYGTYPNWNKAIQLYQWNGVIHWEQFGW